MTIQNFALGIVGLIIGLVFGFFWSGHAVGAAAPANMTTLGNPHDFTNTVFGQLFASSTAKKAKVGQAGTQYTLIKNGTCALLIPNAITASTTMDADCAITGALTTDTFLTPGLASSTVGGFVGVTGGGINVVAVRASSTAGYATFTLVNNTGASYTPAGKGFGSSTPYFQFR